MSLLFNFDMYSKNFIIKLFYRDYCCWEKSGLSAKLREMKCYPPILRALIIAGKIY